MKIDRAWAVGIAGLCTFLNLYAPQAILPALANSFGETVGRTGLTVTAPLLAVAAVAPFVGSISDRLGRKRLIVFACIALALPTLLIPLAGSLQAMIALRFIQGLVLPFIFAVTVAYIGDEAPGAEGIRLTSAYALGSILGGFGGRFIVGIAADLGGWRSGFVALGITALAGAAAMMAWLPMERNFRPITGGIAATLSTYREHFRNARLLATCGVGFCMLFSMVATFTYVNFYLAAPPFSLSPAQLGFVFTVYLLGVVTNPMASRMAQRTGRRAALMLVVGLALGGALLTLAGSLWLVLAGLAILAGGLFVVQTLSLGFVAATVPRAKSTAVGLYVTLYYIGGALGGIIPGLLWQAAGWPGVIALLTIAMVTILVLGTIFWRERPISVSG